MPRVIRRVLILADESAEWLIAGLPQLDRIALTFREFVRSDQPDEPINICILWDPKLEPARRFLPPHSATIGCSITDYAKDETSFDLVLSTRLLLYRDCVPALLDEARDATPAPMSGDKSEAWSHYSSVCGGPRGAADSAKATEQWEYVLDQNEIPACERRFLRRSGKSQDGLVSRYLNRPLSRAVSYWLLKLPLTPSAWSLAIFALPVAASLAFVQGTYGSFVAGFAIFQLYSILDGCDGEIARAKFLQTEWGRRLDSFLDLIGNILMALTLGTGLTREAIRADGIGWPYFLEGIAAAAFIVLSEGIVFIRRTRLENSAPLPAKWHGALYQRHHEFLERSGILILGERFAWWAVQLTKRDMAMLAFVILAIVGWPACALHLLLAVSAISSALASNAFLRQPAPGLAPETS